MTVENGMSTLLDLFATVPVTLFAVLTLFPEALEPYVRSGILRIAQERGKVRIQLIDFRDFARDRHRTVDDRPFGGGPGMLLKPEPIAECVEWLERKHGPFQKFVFCPTGRPFRQPVAEELAHAERVLLLCGRYEGFDARIVPELGFQELSLGDFVLSGGELPALCVVEAAARLVPGVLGDDRSALEDSFGSAGALDCPHYTRPRTWRGASVPDVLLSGDHAAIARWRERESARRTHERRPDLTRKSIPTQPTLRPDAPDREQKGAPERAQ